MTPAQRNGLEDLRLVRFEHEDGELEWLGTYTAYSGREIQSEMLRTRDFRAFMLAPMTGTAARNKGMALFLRMVGGRRSEEHTSELQTLMRTSYAVFCVQNHSQQHKETSTSKDNCSILICRY